MAGHRASRAAAVGVLAGTFAFLLLAGGDPGAGAAPLTERDGRPLAVPTGPGVYEVAWRGLPVVLFLQPPGTVPEDGTPTIDVGGYEAFAISGKSTHMGCSVRDFETWAMRDGALAPGEHAGVLIDLCHQGTWDAFHRGQHIRGPSRGPLPLLDLQYVNGLLAASYFDGPVSPDAPARP